MSLSKKISCQNPQLDKSYYSQREDSLVNYYNPGQIGLFEEFKLSYDKMKIELTKRNQQCDNLIREKKKLEIELMNANKPFYEKQLKRLRQDIQKYQQQNEENKYKYFLAQNAKKELQSTIKVKAEENKKILKELEKEKILSSELTYSNKEKQQRFKIIIDQLENNSSSVCQRFNQLQMKQSELERVLREKKNQIEKFKNTIERYQIKNNQLQSSLKENKSFNADKIAKYEQKNIQLQSELRKLKHQSSARVQKLTSQIEQLRQRLKKQDLITQRLENQNIIRNKQRILQIQNLRYRQRIELLEHELAKKVEIIKNQEKDLKASSNQREMIDLVSKIQELELDKQKIAKYYEKKINDLQQHFSKQKFQTSSERTQIPNNFKSVLANQIQQYGKLKKQLSLKMDEIFNLKEDIQDYKLKVKQLQNEIMLLKRIKLAEEKNSKIQLQINIQNLKNQLDSAQKQVEILSNKLKSREREVKEKDSFIQDIVMTKTKKQDLPFVIAELKRIFQSNYCQKLAQAENKISQLEKKIR